jgi:hypothetical protein
MSAGYARFRQGDLASPTPKQRRETGDPCSAGDHPFDGSKQDGCELAATKVSPVEWIREGETLPPPVSGDPDSLRAMRSWVLEEADGTLRMWYSGHDGTMWRILESVQRGGEGWKRLGVAIDAGFSGGSDEYGSNRPVW